LATAFTPPISAAPRLAIARFGGSKVTTHDLGDMVEVRMHDNDTGIKLEHRDTLFQPFNQAQRGTGLGLSITYDIVARQHGGTNTVDSEPGVFIEFTVFLPRSPVSAPLRGGESAAD
jgi:signal transduction histidine kinase